MIIFAQILPSLSTQQETLQLVVARKTLRPHTQPTAHRLPRPDDPIPRQASRFLTRTKSGLRELKRVASVGVIGGNKRQKLSTGGVAAGLGSHVRVGVEEPAPFKVPNIPTKTKSEVDLKGKAKEFPVDSGGDIFSVESSQTAVQPQIKEKRKHGEIETVEIETDIERANKNVNSFPCQTVIFPRAHFTLCS